MSLKDTVEKMFEDDEHKELVAAYDESDITDSHIAYLLEEPLDHEEFFDDDEELMDIRSLSNSNEDFIRKVKEADLFDKLERLAREHAWADPDLYSIAWDDEKENITATINEMNPDGHWYAHSEALTWRRVPGWKRFDASDGQEFLMNVLPNTSSLTYKLYKTGPKELQLMVWHHDAPTGESMVIEVDHGDNEPEQD